MRDARCKDCADDEVPVCKDETSKRRTLEAAAPIEARPGRPEIRDFECIRNGVSSLYAFYAPLENWRRADAADRRAKLDRAGRIRKIAEEDFPGRSVALAVDNPDRHSKASLFEACPSPGGGGGPPDQVSARHRIRARARKLAGHGGNRNRRHVASMP